MEVELGDTRFDITSRSLVMGILNRTPDSFFDQGGYFDFDDFLRKAEGLVLEGADLLDVGGVKAGPGPEVSEAEELDRVVPAIEALRARFDVPLSVDTWRAAVAKAAFAAGAVVGNDISGFADPEYLPVAAAAGASVVATHIRLAPRVADPEPLYDDVVAEVVSFCADRAARPMPRASRASRVIVDAGLDLGKTEPQSLDAAPGNGRAGRARSSGAAVGVQQALPRRPARPRRGRPSRGHDRRSRARHRARGARPPRPRRAGRPSHGRRDGCAPRRACTCPRMTTHLLRGGDPALLADAVAEPVHTLVGDDDRALVVDDLADEDYEVARIVDAARTPPFLTSRRVVVARHVEQFTRQEQVAPLIEYLGDPLDTTELVLVRRRRRAQGARRGGEVVRWPVVDTDPGRAAKEWIDEQFAAAAVKLEPAARDVIVDRLGEDLGRLPALLDGLEATYGPGARLGEDEVEPFLGDAGGVPPWELTDAIDRGDTAVALDRLARMIGGGDRHPLQVMATL